MFSRISSRLSLTLAVLLHGRRVLSARPDFPSITAEEVAEAQAFFPRPKFFIYGHARSGTTLLMRLIDTHPDVFCTRQAHFFSRPPLLRIGRRSRRGLLAFTQQLPLEPRPGSFPGRQRALQPISSWSVRLPAGAGIVGDKSRKP
jgi:hypothetical protein